MDGDALPAQSGHMKAITTPNTIEPDLPRIIHAATAPPCHPALTNGLTSTDAASSGRLRTRTAGVPSAPPAEATERGPLKAVSSNRLACLCRHWTWANEAKTRFEQELANGWEYGDDPLADHPFGAYYHWCTLLCGFSEVALEHGLLSKVELDVLRPDLEAALPDLRACRQLLGAIPASLEKQPHIVHLLRDSDTLDRLGRLHCAFGGALREEQRSRDLEWFVYEY